MTTFLLLLVAILGGLAVLISQRPNTFRVSRSATIKAPAHMVFDNINELRKWEAWSPWAKLDPNATNSFSGPAGGGRRLHGLGRQQ